MTTTIDAMIPDFSLLTPSACEDRARDAIDRFTHELNELVDTATTMTGREVLHRLDDIQREFDWVLNPVFTLISAVGGAEFDAVRDALNEPLTQATTQFYTNEGLYRVLDAIDRDTLSSEERHALTTLLRDFTLRGVALDADGREALNALNVEIGTLTNQYQQRVSTQLATPVMVGGREYSLNNFTNQLALTQIDDPTLRAELLDQSMRRGWGDDEATDTRALIHDIVAASTRRARLLGFPTHAHLVNASETAPSVDAARQLLSDVAAVAATRVNEEAQTYQQMAQRDGIDELRASDWLYYEEQRRGSELGVSAQALAPYLELWSVVERGVFAAAKQLYGIEMTRREDLHGWDPSCRVYEVHTEEGKSLGLFITDYFTRDGKSGGAWMMPLVSACAATDGQSIIINCANFEPAQEGQPKLLVWDEVITLFHEFGHALHGFLSTTELAMTSGTNVARDFVELPSQLNEMWAYHPAVIASYARHVETGEPMPEQMRERLEQSRTFGEAHATLEYCGAALLDHLWYAEPDTAAQMSVEEFERYALEVGQVAHPLVPPRYRSTYFPHSFTPGYSAAYYSYLWAETLVGEVEQWLRTEGAKDGDGGYNREAGRAVCDQILSRGNSRDPHESFLALVGHEASAEAVLRRRGLDRAFD